MWIPISAFDCAIRHTIVTYASNTTPLPLLISLSLIFNVAMLQLLHLHRKDYSNIRKSGNDICRGSWRLYLRQFYRRKKSTVRGLAFILVSGINHDIPWYRRMERPNQLDSSVAGKRHFTVNNCPAFAQ